MWKALKKITAGLLHIDVLGYVPDERGKKRRGGRKSPTSAAQRFYNAKCSWRECELDLAANFGADAWFLTLTCDDAHLPSNKAGMRKYVQKMVRNLRKARTRRGEDFRYLYTIEGHHGKQTCVPFDADGELEDRRLHIHMVVNRISADDLEEFKSLWPGGGYIRAEKLDVHYYQELAKYFTKEAREFGRAKPGERTWVKSKNCKKYEVQYEDLPDGLTLAPPKGAVDYYSFSTKNPYGFADCVGARYLIFPQRERVEYSYNQPRKRQRPIHFSS